MSYFSTLDALHRELEESREIERGFLHAYEQHLHGWDDAKAAHAREQLEAARARIAEIEADIHAMTAAHSPRGHVA